MGGCNYGVILPINPSMQLKCHNGETHVSLIGSPSKTTDFHYLAIGFTLQAMNFTIQERHNHCENCAGKQTLRKQMSTGRKERTADRVQRYLKKNSRSERKFLQSLLTNHDNYLSVTTFCCSFGIP